MQEFVIKELVMRAAVVRVGKRVENMMRSRRYSSVVKLFLAVALLTLLESAPLQAELKIDITRGNVEPIPVAIARFLARLPREDFDLAVDLMGNMKAAMVLAATRARVRAGLAPHQYREVSGRLAANRFGKGGYLTATGIEDPTRRRGGSI